MRLRASCQHTKLQTLGLSNLVRKLVLAAQAAPTDFAPHAVSQGKAG